MRNKSLAEKFRGLPCIICKNPGEGDHIKNYKGNPKFDVEFNIWALCRFHHIEKGYSLNDFIKKYSLQCEMEERGFYWDATHEKYRHEKLIF